MRAWGIIAVTAAKVKALLSDWWTAPDANTIKTTRTLAIGDNATIAPDANGIRIDGKIGVASSSYATHRLYMLGLAVYNSGLVYLGHESELNKIGSVEIGWNGSGQQVSAKAWPTDDHSSRLTLKAGNALAGDREGEYIEIIGGTGGTGGTGNHDGGSVFLDGGEATGTGEDGDVVVGASRGSLIVRTEEKLAHVGMGGGYVRKYATVTKDLSGASTALGFSIPAGAILKAVQLRVDSTITSGDGATSWDAAYSGGGSESICAGQAFTKDTKVNAPFNPNGSTPITSDATDVTITPDSGTFSGGTVSAVVYYDELETLPDTPAA